jgi:hypothetical protein
MTEFWYFDADTVDIELKTSLCVLYTTCIDCLAVCVKVWLGSTEPRFSSWQLGFYIEHIAIDVRYITRLLPD